MLRALVRAVLLEEDSPVASGSVDPKAVPGLYRKRDGTYDYVFQPSDFKDIEFKIPDFSAIDLEEPEQDYAKTIEIESAYEVLNNPAKYNVNKANWSNDARPGFTSKPVPHPRKKNKDGSYFMSQHKGMDISFTGAGMTEAMPAIAVETGTVSIQVADADAEKEGTGNVVMLDLGGGITVRYLHLNTITATTGATVQRGDKLGMLGQTGTPNSPHLHFEVYKGDNAVNPIPYLTDSSKNWAFPAGVIQK